MALRNDAATGGAPLGTAALRAGGLALALLAALLLAPRPPAPAEESPRRVPAAPLRGAPLLDSVATQPGDLDPPRPPAARRDLPAPAPPRAEPGLGLDDRLAIAGVSRGDPVFIRVFKESRELELWLRGGERFTLAKIYPICAYSGGLGPKRREGDRQAPEGFYRVPREALNPNSRFHLSFNLGYPNAYDRAHGRTGSYLMVHGNCVSIGCYAMTDPGIEEIYGLVEAALDRGQPAAPAHLFPFRLTEAALAARGRSPWIGFWRNLKQGYDLFERDRLPPEASVEDGGYAFAPAIARR